MAKDNLTIEVEGDETDNAIAILKISGTLDVSGIAMLYGVFDKIIAEKRNFVVIDMNCVLSICSSALGELMRYRNKFLELRGDIVLVNLSGDVRSKLTVLGANRIFSFYQDVRAAINAYKWDYKNEGKAVTVSFPPFLKLIPSVRQLASRLVRQNGYSTKDAFRIETIVDEVCNNAVDHGKKDAASEITLSIVIDKEKVAITVVNQSDPQKVSVLRELVGGSDTPSHVGEDEKRGRGLAMIRMLSSNMEVNITERGTSVHVIKLREE